MQFRDFMLAKVSCQICNSNKNEVRAVKEMSGDYIYECEKCFKLIETKNEMMYDSEVKHK